MKFEIKGEDLPVVILDMEAGERVFTESGGMAWMTDHFDMSTNMEGGLFKALGRSISGESMFMVSYQCKRGSGQIAFASSFPGKIIPLSLQPGQSIICQKSSFLCAESSVQLEMFFRKRLGAGLFGGEGFIMQKITGPGLAFVELDGGVVEYNLQPGEVMKVDTGHVAMLEPSVSFDIEMVKGFKNIFFGGEGLFLATLRGPGRIWLQSMPVQNLARLLIPFMPTSDK